MEIVKIYDEDNGDLVETIATKNNCYDLINACIHTYHNAITDLYDDKELEVMKHLQEELTTTEEDMKIMQYINNQIDTTNYEDYEVRDTIVMIKENGLYQFICSVLDYYDELVDMGTMEVFI